MPRLIPAITLAAATFWMTVSADAKEPWRGRLESVDEVEVQQPAARHEFSLAVEVPRTYDTRVVCDKGPTEIDVSGVMGPLVERIFRPHFPNMRLVASMKESSGSDLYVYIRILTDGLNITLLDPRTNDALELYYQKNPSRLEEGLNYTSYTYRLTQCDRRRIMKGLRRGLAADTAALAAWLASNPRVPLYLRMVKDVLEKEASADAASQAGEKVKAFVHYRKALEGLADHAGSRHYGRVHGKFIELVAGMDRRPPVPEEAERFMIRGQAALKEGKEQSIVIDEMTRAITFGPWWAEAYFNRAVIYEKVDRKKAREDYAVFLKLKPGAPDKDEIRRKIYALEVR